MDLQPSLAFAPQKRKLSCVLDTLPSRFANDRTQAVASSSLQNGAPSGPVLASNIPSFPNHRPGNTDLRGLKVEIGHNGVIHTLDRGPNLVAKGLIGGRIITGFF